MDQNTEPRQPANFIPGLTLDKIKDQLVVLRDDKGKYKRKFKHTRKFSELNNLQKLV